MKPQESQGKRAQGGTTVQGIVPLYYGGRSHARAARTAMCGDRALAHGRITKVVRFQLFFEASLFIVFFLSR